MKDEQCPKHYGETKRLSPSEAKLARIRKGLRSVGVNLTPSSGRPRK